MTRKPKAVEPDVVTEEKPAEAPKPKPVEPEKPIKLTPNPYKN